MKTIYLLAPLLLVCLSGIKSHGAYPALITKKCPYDIEEPKGSSGYYVSEECDTIMVKPPVEGSAMVRSFSPSMSLLLCEDYVKEVKEAEALGPMIAKLRKEIAELGETDMARVAFLKAKLEILIGEKDRLLSQYDNYEGAKAQIVFNLEYADMVNKFRKTNINARTDEGRPVIFERVPISTGFISFDVNGDAATNVNAGIKNKSILRTSLPGLKRPVSETEFDPQSGFFGNAYSGSIMLSLSGACPIVEGIEYKDYKRIRITNESLNAHLVANFNYAVPVHAYMEIKARYVGKNALTYVNETIKESKQIKVNEITNRALEGKRNDVLTFKVERYEGALSELDSAEAQANLRAVLMADMTASFLALLAQDGMLVVVPDPTVNAPAGQMINEKRMRRVCHRENNGIFGMGNDHCGDVPYYEPVWTDGRADAVITNKNNSEYEVVREWSVGQTITRTDSSTFVFNVDRVNN